MKDAYYFPHDSNAKDDPKCVLLIEQLGMEGYGIYWVLIETLREQPDYKYPLILLPAIARRFNSTVEKVKSVVLNYGLFSVNEKEFFYSGSLIERMIKYDEKRLLARKAGLRSAEIRQLNLTSVERPLNDGSTSIVEYSKEEYSKVKNCLFKNSQFNTIELFKKEFENTEWQKADLKHYFESIIDWSNSKGKMSKDWIATARNWMRKDKQESKLKLAPQPKINPQNDR